MWYLAIISLIIFLFLSLLVLYKVKENYQFAAKLIIWLCLLLFVAITCTLSKDYVNYEIMFNNALNNIITNEISFFLISKIISVFSQSVWFVFIVYAFLSVTIKFHAIKKLSQFFFPSLLVYYSYYFFLHEITQIRAAVSASFILMCIIEIVKSDFKKFLLFSILASFFHYSAIIILPFYFLKRNKIQNFYYFLVPVGFIIFLTGYNLTSLIGLIDIQYIKIKYETYLKMASFEKINVFNVTEIFRYIFCYLLLWKWKYIYEKTPYAVIVIKIYIFSVFSLLAFADIPTIAFRISELLGITEIIAIPYLIYLVKYEAFKKIITPAISFYFLFIVIVYENLLKLF